MSIPSTFAVRLAPAAAWTGTVLLALSIRTLLTDVTGARDAAEAASFRGLFSKYSGVTLSATAVYFTIATLGPRLTSRWVTTSALIFCFTVELLQLTPLPRWLSSHHLVLRLIFGEYFGAWDLPCYALGVALALWLDRRFVRPAPRV